MKPIILVVCVLLALQAAQAWHTPGVVSRLVGRGRTTTTPPAAAPSSPSSSGGSTTSTENEDVVKDSDIVGGKDALKNIRANWNTFWDTVKAKLTPAKKAQIEDEARKEDAKKPVPTATPADPSEISSEEKPVSSSPRAPSQAAATTTTLIEEGDEVRGATFEIELSGKSYIRPVNALTCPEICRWNPFDPTCAALATGFCASMPSPAGVVSTVHEPYGPTGNFRLYSKMKFRLTCANGKPTAASIVSRSSKTGMEGPLQAPDGDFVKTHAKVRNGVAYIGYQFIGRPPVVLEPGFLAIRFRTCPYIWHYPYYKINSCGDDGSWSGTYSFGHSNFPTHRLWRDGGLVETVAQRHIKALWRASSADMTLVRGVWPTVI